MTLPRSTEAAAVGLAGIAIATWRFRRRLLLWLPCAVTIHVDILDVIRSGCFFVTSFAASTLGTGMRNADRKQDTKADGFDSHFPAPGLRHV